MSHKKLIRICALVMGLSGATIIFSTLFPIVSYEWEAAQKYPILISPLVDTDTGSFKFSKTDYTKASNWFVGSEDEVFEADSVKEYKLSIPKLKVDNASVAIGGEDLAESLIQYPGTSVPGKVGNSVIFGHSILPIFYDPSNYLAVFSTLNTLKEGDPIYIAYDGINYTYKVEYMFEVRPTDIQILEQNSDHPYLTLVTCTPPGDPRKPKRLIVRAKLIPPAEQDEITRS